MITKTVTVYNMNRFDSKLESLNRKVAKMGLRPVRKGNVVEETKYVKNRFGENVEVFSHYAVDIILREEIVQFPGGWGLVGVVDHVESLVRSVPDYAGVPLHPFLENGSVCEHCHTDRKRNETFIVVNNAGRMVQVGRDCVGQLLGISPERALGQIEVVREVLTDEEWLGDRQVRGIDLGFFLSHVACLVRVAGWRSRSAAQESGNEVRATADLAWDNIDNEERKLRNHWGEQLWYDRTPADVELAKRVAAWLEALGETDGLNDYLSNLAQIGRNGFVTAKSLGFAASAVAAYQKDQERKVKQAVEKEGKPESSFVGKVGERITFNKLFLVKSFGFDSAWGYTFVHKFLDEQGNVLVWKTGVELDQDEAYKVVANVKGHEEYRGEKQTVLTRAKTLKLEVA